MFKNFEFSFDIEIKAKKNKLKFYYDFKRVINFNIELIEF